MFHNPGLLMSPQPSPLPFVCDCALWCSNLVTGLVLLQLDLLMHPVHPTPPCPCSRYQKHWHVSASPILLLFHCYLTYHLYVVGILVPAKSTLSCITTWLAINTLDSLITDVSSNCIYVALIYRPINCKLLQLKSPFNKHCPFFCLYWRKVLRILESFGFGSFRL